MNEFYYQYEKRPPVLTEGQRKMRYAFAAGFVSVLGFEIWLLVRTFLLM